MWREVAPGRGLPPADRGWNIYGASPGPFARGVTRRAAGIQHARAVDFPAGSRPRSWSNTAWSPSGSGRVPGVAIRVTPRDLSHRVRGLGEGRSDPLPSRILRAHWTPSPGGLRA